MNKAAPAAAAPDRLIKLTIDDSTRGDEEGVASGGRRPFLYGETRRDWKPVTVYIALVH